MRDQKPCVFTKVFEAVSALFFLLVLVFVVTQVLVRYLLPVSIPWTEEVARYSLVAMTFFGAAVALRKGNHICVSTFLERMSPRRQKLFYLSFVPPMIFFLSVIFFGSLGMAKRMWYSPVGSISWFRMGHLYVISIAGSVLMVVALLFWTVEKARFSVKLPSCARGGGDEWQL